MDKTLQLIDSLIIMLLKELESNNPKFKGAWIENDKVTLFKSIDLDTGTLKEPVVLLDKTQLNEKSIDELVLDRILNYLKYRQRIFTFSLKPYRVGKEVNYPKGYHIITSVANPSSINTLCSRPENYIELIALNLYPFNSHEAQERIETLGLSDNTADHDAKNYIAEYQISDDKDIVIHTLLQHNFYRGGLTNTKYIIGIDSNTGQQTRLQSLPKPMGDDTGVKLLTFEKQGYAATVSNLEILESKISMSYYNLYNGELPALHGDVFKLNPGLYLTSHTNASEVLHYLTANKANRIIPCLSFIHDTVSTSKAHTTIDCIDLEKIPELKVEYVQSIKILYDIVFLPNLRAIPMDKLIDICQSCCVITFESIGTLQDVSNILYQFPEYINSILDLLQGIILPNKNLYLKCNSGIRNLIRENNPLMSELQFVHYIGVIKKDLNGSLPLTMGMLIQRVIEKFKTIIISEEGIFYTQNDSTLPYKEGALNYNITSSDIIQYLIAFDEKEFNTLICSKVKTGYASAIIRLQVQDTFEDFKVSIIKTGGRFKISMDNLSNRYLKKTDYTTEAFYSIKPIPQGMYFINTPPNGGKKTILKNILNELPQEVSKSILIINPEKDIVEGNLRPENTANLNILYDTLDAVAIIRELQPTTLIITRVDDSKLLPALQKIIAPSQLIIVLSPHRYLLDALADYYNTSEEVIECINQYLTLSISQQLISNENEAIPIYEIITGESLRENMNRSEQSTCSCKLTPYELCNDLSKEIKPMKTYTKQLKDLIENNIITKAQSQLYYK